MVSALAITGAYGLMTAAAEETEEEPDVYKRQDMSYAGVSSYEYGNRIYSIEVNKTIAEPEVSLKNGKYYVRLPAGKTWYITLENKLVEG